MRGLANRIAMTGKKQSFSAKSYVQDGLVMLLDGIENVDFSQHDSTSLYWKDLIGDLSFYTRNNTWNDNNLHIDGCNYKSIYMTNIPITLNGQFTIEVCFDWEKSSNNEYGRIICWRDNSYQLCEILFEKNTGGIGFVEFGTNFEGIRTSTFDYSGIHTYTSRFADNLHTGNIDGLSMSVSGAVTYAGGTPNALVIGSNQYGYQNCSVIGCYYNVRIYNRKLTDIEVALNYAVDKARFNLS